MRYLRSLALMAISALLFGSEPSRPLPALAAESAQFTSMEIPQQKDQRIDKSGFSLSVNVNLVTVDTLVRSARGSIVGDLQADDFTVYDNGVAQHLTHFSIDQLPLAVALVIDCSGSITSFFQELRESALSALQLLKPEDQVVCFSFDETPRQRTELTVNRNEIVLKIAGLQIGPGTNVYDAISDAAQYLRLKAPNRRRAIILVSDNCPNIFHVNEKDALREVVEAAATLYSIRTPGDNPADSAASPASVERIARGTGGEVLDGRKAGAFTRALESAILNLRQVYTLGFSPSNMGQDGDYHRLAVKLNAARRCPDCRVQARAGYYDATQESLDTARQAASLLGFKDILADNSIRSARAEASEIGDIAFKVRTSQAKDNEGRTQIKVDLQIAPKRIRFQRESSRHMAKLRIAIFCADAKGKDLGEDSRTVDLDLPEDKYRQTMLSSISYSAQIPLPATSPFLKVIVCDVWSGEVGSKLVRVR